MLLPAEDDCNNISVLVLESALVRDEPPISAEFSSLQQFTINLTKFTSMKQ
jgi:hypothetical protein